MPIKSINALRNKRCFSTFLLSVNPFDSNLCNTNASIGFFTKDVFLIWGIIGSLIFLKAQWFLSFSVIMKPDAISSGSMLAVLAPVLIHNFNNSISCFCNFFLPGGIS